MIEKNRQRERKKEIKKEKVSERERERERETWKNRTLTTFVISTGSWFLLWRLFACMRAHMPVNLNENIVE